MREMSSGLMLVCCVLPFVFGCSSGRAEVETHPVSGKVSFDGKPLEKGEISFANVEQGFVRSFEIANGKFAGQAMAGSLRVEVYSYRVGKVDPMYKDDPTAKPSMENIIAAKFNVDSTLTAEVKPDEENVYEFSVSK